MSGSSTFSRREALSLLGVAAGGAVAASATAAEAPEEIAAAGSKHSQYIFGYGSLIERESRLAT